MPPGNPPGHTATTRARGHDTPLHRGSTGTVPLEHTVTAAQSPPTKPSQTSTPPAGPRHSTQQVTVPTAPSTERLHSHQLLGVRVRIVRAHIHYGPGSSFEVPDSVRFLLFPQFLPFSGTGVGRSGGSRRCARYRSDRQYLTGFRCRSRALPRVVLLAAALMAL